ncbi:hypothetical protein E4T56_gene13548 [Termitomyces sp. T112]|nr:hypothetical protein E4T56_gene13548 [Termitomyces sp. T112]
MLNILNNLMEWKSILHTGVSGTSSIEMLYGPELSESILSGLFRLAMPRKMLCECGRRTICAMTTGSASSMLPTSITEDGGIPLVEKTNFFLEYTFTCQFLKTCASSLIPFSKRLRRTDSRNKMAGICHPCDAFHASNRDLGKAIGQEKPRAWFISHKRSGALAIAAYMMVASSKRPGGQETTSLTGAWARTTCFENENMTAGTKI